MFKIINIYTIEKLTNSLIIFDDNLIRLNLLLLLFSNNYNRKLLMYISVKCLQQRNYFYMYISVTKSVNIEKFVFRGTILKLISVLKKFNSPCCKQFE